eukprot:1151327-Pelagomonas_calceolata.AAC.4
MYLFSRAIDVDTAPIGEQVDIPGEAQAIHGLQLYSKYKQSLPILTILASAKLQAQIWPACVCSGLHTHHGPTQHVLN